MMRVLFCSIILGVCYILAEENGFVTTTEISKKYSKEDRLLADIIRTKNSSQLILDESNEEDLKKANKKSRTIVHRDSSFESRDKTFLLASSSCCGGSKYNSNGSARPNHNFIKIPLETGRYPSQYGERQPVDRYGWQTQARPPGSVGSGGRPGGSGSYGNGVYAGSHSGDRYGPRPSAYGNESANRPSALGYGITGNTGGYGYGISGYGGYGRPTGYGGSIGSGGSYGISGTLADGDEFGPGDPAYPDGNVPHQPGNIHAQKAVALKALAGVALIGAAAALASNPILLPIGIVAGRRKRSEGFSEEAQTDIQMDYVLNALKENLAKIQKYGSSDRLIISPRCVAKLTCEIQKDYLLDLEEDGEISKKDVEILNIHRKQYFTNLIQNNVLSTTSVSSNVKSLIKLAIDVATANRSCNVFSCNYIRKG